VSYGDFVIGFNPTQLNDNLDRSIKKVCQWPTDLPNLEDSVVDENEVKVDDLKGKKICWKEKLVRTGSQETGVVREEKFKLIDGDVKVETVDGIPSITFLKRVHKHIEKRMTRTMIIKLMGRRIAFNEEDYSAVLIGGPWIIFGQYLTIRPWSPLFSTTQYTPRKDGALDPITKII
ncbi:hypothetical protein Gogos_001299, partial [Gossypium gossypioides]|nr:hypothetical protein [Gossypium gossypioides]